MKLMTLRRVALLVLLLATLAAIGGRFYGYVVAKDFTAYFYGDCDAETSSCFVADCDPADPLCDSTPYTKLAVPFTNTPSCLLEYACEDFSCQETTGCEETFCSDDSLEDGEICTSPL